MSQSEKQQKSTRSWLDLGKLAIGGIAVAVVGFWPESVAGQALITRVMPVVVYALVAVWGWNQ